jgi:hypothetical protein
MTESEYIEQLKQAGGETYRSQVFDRTVHIRTAYWTGREFTEAEAVRVAALLTQGAAELRRRREEKQND